MEQFHRSPTIRMLAKEVMDSTVQLQNGEKDTYQPSIYLSPTGAEINRVLIAGTAVEKEDVGTDNPFWRVRVVDPTGAFYVYAGQYQPEATKAIQKLEVPCFVIVSGKLSHYTPEQGGNTVVSIRAESIATVTPEQCDQALADIADHTVRRILSAKTNKNVQCYYGNYDLTGFVKSIKEMLNQIIADNGQAVKPPQPPTPQNAAKEASVPAKPLSEKVIVAGVPPVEWKKPADIPPETKPPVQEPPKAAQEAAKPASTEKVKKAKKKEAAKGPAEPAKEPAKEVPAAAPPAAPPETPKEAPKQASPAPVLQDSEKMVLDILKTHKPQGALARDTIANVLRALGYAMLDVDGILANLKKIGEIIEPTTGFFRAV